MISPIFKRVIAPLLSLVALGKPIYSQEPIEGFSPYSFGITVEEAMELADLSFDALDQNLGTLYNAPSVSVGGDEYEVSLAFQDDVLTQVSLSRWIEGDISAVRCETEFHNVLGAVQARYGDPDGPTLTRNIFGVRALEARFTRVDSSQIRVLASSTAICLIKVDYLAGSEGSTF